MRLYGYVHSLIAFYSSFVLSSSVSLRHFRLHRIRIRLSSAALCLSSAFFRVCAALSKWRIHFISRACGGSGNKKSKRSEQERRKSSALQIRAAISGTLNVGVCLVVKCVGRRFSTLIYIKVIDSASTGHKHRRRTRFAGCTPRSRAAEIRSSRPCLHSRGTTCARSRRTGCVCLCARRAGLSSQSRPRASEKGESRAASSRGDSDGRSASNLYNELNENV